MKKFIYLLLFLAIGRTATAQTLSVADVEVLQGETASYALNINTGDGIYQSFQCDVQFPATGFSIPAVPNTTVNPSWSATFRQSDAMNNGAYRLSAVGLMMIPTGDIEIGTVAFTVGADTPAGEYDVTITNFEFITTTTRQRANDVTFKVKVVNTLTLDENSTTPPPGHFSGNVRVKRTINANEWGTICLPFEMGEEELKAAFGDDVRLCTFEGCETTMNGSEVVDIKVNFKPATILNSNTPYIIKVSQPVTEFTLENWYIKTGDPQSWEDEKKIGRNYFYNKFIVTYVAETTVPNQCLFLSGGKFYYSKGMTKMKGFRAYFDFYDILPEVDVTAGAKISLNIDDGGTTGVESVECRTDSSEGWYTLDGMKLNGEPKKKGIYIYNGKKVKK